MKEMKRFNREVSEVEVFIEAIPTTLIMTFLMVQGLLNDGDPARLNPGTIGALLIGEQYCFENENFSRIECSDWYISPNYFFFFLAYSTSIVSSSLGLSKCLKVGPCKILGENGFCSVRFILLFLSMCFTLDSKGLALGFALGDPNLSRTVALLVALSTMFLPGLLLVIVGFCHYKLCIRDMIAHPSLLLLPIVTHYTLSATRKGDTMVKFSRRWTFINLGLSLLGHIVYSSLIYMMVKDKPVEFDASGRRRLEAWKFYFFTFPVPLLGFVLTLVFLLLDSCCPCVPCGSRLERHVLKPEDSLVEYVEDNSTGKRMVVQRETEVLQQIVLKPCISANSNK
jgi:hypothetical protein